MLLLTKLICSERVIKSRALLINFIRSTLDFNVVEEENLQDGANLMVPTKKDKNHRHQMLKTPVKNPRKSKADPKAYELAYRQHIIFQDETNKTDIYDISLYPDLWEEGHTRGEPNYAMLDVSKFAKYRTEMNM